MKCVHCKTDLTPHEGGGAKQGALHCYGCDCCFTADGKTPREGVPVCDRAGVKEEAEPAKEEGPSAEAKPAGRGRRGR
jgi:hypothetical protein